MIKSTYENVGHTPNDTKVDTIPKGIEFFLIFLSSGQTFLHKQTDRHPIFIG